MATSAESEPVRVGNYGVTVDRRDAPRAVALIAYQDGGVDPYTVVDWLPYDGRADNLWRALVGRGIPSQIAAQLVVELAGKSPAIR